MIARTWLQKPGDREMGRCVGLWRRGSNSRPLHRGRARCRRWPVFRYARHFHVPRRRQGCNLPPGPLTTTQLMRSRVWLRVIATPSRRRFLPKRAKPHSFVQRIARDVMEIEKCLRKARAARPLGDGCTGGSGGRRRGGKDWGIRAKRDSPCSSSTRRLNEHCVNRRQNVRAIDAKN